MAVSQSRNAVTIHEYSSRPSRSLAIIVPHVPMIVPSRHTTVVANARPIMHSFLESNPVPLDDILSVVQSYTRIYGYSFCTMVCLAI